MDTHRKGWLPWWARIAVTALALVGAATITGPAMASPTPASQHVASATVPAAGCGPAHRASGKFSLRRVAAMHDNADVAYLLAATLRCNGGRWYPAFLQWYLDGGSLMVPLLPGTRLWFRAPGIGQPAAVLPDTQNWPPAS